MADRNPSSGHLHHSRPGAGSCCLAAKDVTRLGKAKLLQSEEDWQFLSDYLLVLNQNWTRYLVDEVRDAEEQDDVRRRKEVTAATEVLRKVGFDETGNASGMMQQVAQAFFAQEERPHRRLC